MALLKLSLMAFSFVLWAAGLTMLTLGIWAKVSLGSYLALSANPAPNAPFILLAAGAAVLVWSFLGCFSAATEHRCLLRAYSAFQRAGLATGLPAGGLSALFHRGDIAAGLRAGLREAVRAYGEDQREADALDSLQRALGCCGAERYRDWLTSPCSLAQPGRNASVPGSCCRARRSCQHSPLPPDARGIHRHGCFARVSGFVSDNLFGIATAALGLGLLQGLGIVLACLRAARLRASPTAPHTSRPGVPSPRPARPPAPRQRSLGVPEPCPSLRLSPAPAPSSAGPTALSTPSSCPVQPGAQLPPPHLP